VRDNELFQSHLDEAIGVINNGAWSNFLWDLISRDSGKFLGQTLLILRKQLDIGSITQLDLLNVAMTSRDENGRTLLHVAAASENSNALSFCQFYADEIDFNLKTANNSGRTVRDIACASANVELSKWAKLCWNLEDIINNGVWFSFTFTLIIGEDANLLTLFLHILQNALDKNRITESEILNVMLKSREENENTLIHRVIMQGHVHALPFCEFFTNVIKFNLDTVDNLNRTVRHIACASKNTELSKWARTHEMFLGRYEIEGGKGLRSDPVHRSERSSVFFARDVTKKERDPHQYVALKLIHEATNFSTELEARLKCKSYLFSSGQDIGHGKNNYEDDHVIPLLRYHKERSNSSNIHCLVMLKGGKNLSQIIETERIAGWDTQKLHIYGKYLGRAIEHIHNRGYIHADIKPRNVIRTSNGYIKLIDFSSSVNIDAHLTDKSVSSAFLCPELAKIKLRPQKSVEYLKSKLEEIKKRRKDSSVLKNESDNKLELERMVEDVRAVKSNIEYSMLIKEESLVESRYKAQRQMDIWGFGLIIYYLYTGKPLFFYDLEGRFVNESDKKGLTDWNGLVDDDFTHLVLKDCHDENKNIIKVEAIDFLKKCLHKNPQERFQTMIEALRHPLLIRIY